MNTRLLALMLIALVSCNKPQEIAEAPAAPKAKQDPDADLIDHTWAGKVHTSVGELKFKRAGAGLAAEMAYQLWGRVILKDTFTVTRAADGTITLTGAPENRFIGGQRFALAALSGKLSADKSSIGGKHTLPQGEIEWSASHKQTVKELDPPLDVVEAQKALVSAPWEGTIGDKPVKLIFEDKAGKLTGTLSDGKDKTTVDATVGADGAVRFKAVPKATQQGLLTRDFAGYFGTMELKRFAGTVVVATKQGFVEQSSDERFVFDRQSKEGAAPKASGKKK